MVKNKKLLAFCIASIFAFPFTTYAEGEGHYRSLFQHTDLTINADSTSVLDEEYIWRGVDQQGANGLGQQYLSFDQDKQELEIIEAETIRANGEKVKVPAADIKLQDGMLGGISYPHRKLYQITFPSFRPEMPSICTTVKSKPSLTYQVATRTVPTITAMSSEITHHILYIIRRMWHCTLQAMSLIKLKTRFQAGCTPSSGRITARIPKPVIRIW